MLRPSARLSCCYLAEIIFLSLWLYQGDALAEDASATQRQLDPAAWGKNHVGRTFPEYVTGDECLFCHRDIGKSWPENRHQLTIRRASIDTPELLQLRKIEGMESFADDVEFVMGHHRASRYLKRSKHYGKFELLSNLSAKGRQPTACPEPNANTMPRWDESHFGARCAGCHATAVDNGSQAFSAVSIDCVACHGSVDLKHTTNPGRVLLSKSNRMPREVISICGQCHLRGGKSKSSGRPYANTFVAGDNLFLDFEVDLSVEALEKLAPADRHIFESARDVAILGQESTCLSCHHVHSQSTDRHQSLASSARCQTCHKPETEHTELRPSFLRSRGPAGHSTVCEY